MEGWDIPGACGCAATVGGPGAPVPAEPACLQPQQSANNCTNCLHSRQH